MKFIIYILFYILLTIGYYLLLSIVGIILGYTYQQTIQNLSWAIIYFMFIHWWLVGLSLREYWIKHITPTL